MAQLTWKIERRDTITAGGAATSYPTTIYITACGRFRVFKSWVAGDGPLHPCGWSWNMVDLKPGPRRGTTHGFATAKRAKANAERVLEREAEWAAAE